MSAVHAKVRLDGLRLEAPPSSYSATVILPFMSAGHRGSVQGFAKREPGRSLEALGLRTVPEVAMTTCAWVLSRNGPLSERDC